MPKAPKKAAKEARADEAVSQPEPVAELPTDAHTYYVWKHGVFVKLFSNEPYKGEALKFAKLFAEEIGGTVQI